MKPISPPENFRLKVSIGLVLLIAFAAFYWFFGDFISGSIRGFARRHETLPALSIENGRTVYCRMQNCDFRFPLPDDASVRQMDPVKGKFDTAEGVLYLEGRDGKVVDLSAYAKLLRRNRFQVEQSTWQVEARSTQPEGGRITIEASDDTAKIHFAYFGDY